MGVPSVAGGAAFLAVVVLGSLASDLVAPEPVHSVRTVGQHAGTFGPAPALAVVAAPGIEHPVWWRPATEPVAVAAPPVVLVDGLTLAAADDAPAFATAAEAEQAAAQLRAAEPGRRVAVAGAWEAQS